MRRSCLLIVWVIAACGDDQLVVGDASVPPPPTPTSIDAPASLTIVEGETTTFTVRLAEPPTEAVVVDVSASDAGAISVAPSSIIFGPHQVTADVTVTSGEDDDNVVNESTEIVLSIVGGDSRRVKTRVIDNDIQQIIANATNLTVAEAGTATATVRLARRPAAPVTVAVWSDAPQVAIANPTSVTFEPELYATPATITIAGVADQNTANGAAHVYAGQVPNVTDVRVDVAVTDNDVQALVLSATNLPVTEGSTGTFTVRLAFDPLQPTLVQIGSSDPSAVGIGSQASVQFDSSNYNVPQNVTLQGSEDADGSNENVTVSLSGAATANVTVPVTDNDLLEVQDSSVIEGQSSTFYVVATDQPRTPLPVTVDVISGDVTVSPASFYVSSTLTASDFTVTPLIDASSTSNRTALLRVSSPGQTPRDIPITIYDRIPGTLNSTSLSYENATAGALGYVDVSFNAPNGWAGDGRFVMTFPAGYDASAATFLSSTADGAYSLSATTSSVTLSRSNGTSTISTVKVRIGGIRNPPLSGSFTIALATQTATGEARDNGTVAALLFPGQMQAANVTLGDSQPGATTTITFAFTTRNPWPADGKLTIYIPAVFNVTAAAVTAQSGVDGTLDVTSSGNTLTLVRSGGTTTPGGTTVAITLGNIVNPQSAQATDEFSVGTLTASGVAIDNGGASGVVIGCPATITKAPHRGSNLPSGGNAWQYPDGVTSPSWGTDVAYINRVTASDYLVASDFRFTVPVGATVAGIQFDVEREGYNAVDRSVHVVRSTLGQADRASASLWTTQPVSYGSATDLWGEAWARADVESSTFGIAMSVNAATQGMPSSVRVGYVTATLYLSCP